MLPNRHMVELAGRGTGSKGEDRLRFNFAALVGLVASQR